MGRKKRQEKPVPQVAEPRTKAVRVDLTPEDHHLLRIVAAKANQPMSAYARDLVIRHVREEAGEKGGDR